jgi:hypothetical protein
MFSIRWVQLSCYVAVVDCNHTVFKQLVIVGIRYAKKLIKIYFLCSGDKIMATSPQRLGLHRGILNG